MLGHPIAHSLSPALHRAAYAALGLEGWRYDAVDVTADALPAFLAGLDDAWAGLSLTMPLKQTVLPLLDHVEPLADVVGAVNTVLVQAGAGTGVAGGPVLVGANTDVYGIVTALQEGLRDRPRGRRPGDGPAGAPADRTAAVLGAGATAASCLAALAQLGCTTPVVYVRSMGRIGSLMRAAHRMGVEPRYAPLAAAADEFGAADLVVSTLPAHAADDVAAGLGAAVASRAAGIASRAAGGDGPHGVLLDVVYDPFPTALSSAWARAGGVVVGGDRMLLHQAAEQVRLMTGLVAPVEAMAGVLGARSVHR
ncbi:shikimate dehydrogenase [Pengzhenrongella sicca]|uniref:shikimate dehydrogenase n=1 Tax=Pengzhenrongella sicca TaxID=2819238 RepID=UPI002221A0A3|nr:shikimate dehydrogenase [Pengzhenrongella sicca]